MLEDVEMDWIWWQLKVYLIKQNIWVELTEKIDLEKSVLVDVGSFLLWLAYMRKV